MPELYWKDDPFEADREDVREAIQALVVKRRGDFPNLEEFRHRALEAVGGYLHIRDSDLESFIAEMRAWGSFEDNEAMQGKFLNPLSKASGLGPAFDDEDGVVPTFVTPDEIAYALDKLESSGATVALTWNVFDRNYRWLRWLRFLRDAGEHGGVAA